ncbi:hypothetical protein ACFL28_03185 [Candidatus Omnitrophota bacterium]
MSIINEAIKKAREEFKKKDPIKDPAERDSIRTVSLKTFEKKWLVLTTISSILILSLLGSVLLYRHISRLDEDYSSDTLSVKSKAAPTPIRKANQKRGRHKSAIELNGIVYGPEDKWAIINNEIVREGDFLSDGEITLIAADFVKIEKRNGQEIVMNLR